MFNKYKTLSIEVKAGIWFVICNFINKAISMIVIPIYTRFLSTSEFGTYTVFQSWLNILIIVVTLEISRGHYALGITKYDDDADRYTTSMLGLGSATTLLFLLIYLCAIPMFNNILQMNTPLVIGMFGYFFFYPAWKFWCINQRFAYKYKKMVLGTTSVALLTPIIGVVGIVGFGFKSEAAILSILIVQGVVSLALYIFYFTRSRSLYVKKYWREVLPYSVNLLPYMLATMVLGQADRLMIDRMISPSCAAIYSVAYSVAMLPILFGTALNFTFVPWFFRRLKEKKYEKIEPVADGLQTLVGIFNLALMIFAPEAMAFFAPPQYLDAISIIPAVTSSTYFMFIFQRYINLEMYYEKTLSVSVISVFVAILNIVLNYICIKVWGYLAAGYTTLVCYILFCVGHYFVVVWIERTKCDGRIVFHAKGTVIKGAFFLAMSFGVLWLYDYTILRYSVALCLALAAYCKRGVLLSLLANRNLNPA